MGLALKDSQLHCYCDYMTWPNDKRYELIDGHAFLMSPGPDLEHQDIAGEIYLQARLALTNKPCRAFIAPLDVRLPKNNEADQDIDTVVQPDVMVVCDSSKLDRRGIRGAPDWVVEVISPSTASHDQIRKQKIYERHGIREYWLVHPIDRVLTVYRLVDGVYGKPDLYELSGETAVWIIPEIVIRWDELIARLPDHLQD